MPIFKQLEEIFMGTEADEEVDYEADDETDDETYEQPDITNMPELESEESAEQRGQGVRVLTPQQMISRLPILLDHLHTSWT